MAQLEVVEEESKSILSRNESPDIGFRWSINPYRGCYHACAYCYARPTHQYLGYGAGTDFDRKIVVKINAVELLEAAFQKPSWQGESIALSGNTDCYQPLEAHYRLTRGLLELCEAYRNPVGIITKSSVIRRDIELLAKLARVARCRVTMSIAFVDDALARAIEPGASPIGKRFETLKMLADAGIDCGISCAPLIPGLNDESIPELLQRAKAAGATRASTTLIRLPAEVQPVFEERIVEAFPLRAAKIMNAVHEMRGGQAYRSEFFQRQVGQGERWRMTERLFQTQARRLGFEYEGMDATGLSDEPGSALRTFRRPKRQLDLFE